MRPCKVMEQNCAHYARMITRLAGLEKTKGDIFSNLQTLSTYIYKQGYESVQTLWIPFLTSSKSYRFNLLLIKV